MRAPVTSAVAPTSSKQQLRLFIVALLGVACLILAFGSLPPRYLPWRVASAIEARRVDILLWGLAALVSAMAAIYWTGAL